MSKLLFILKHREAPYTDETNYSKGGLSSGLLNSASFVVNMLQDAGVEAKLVQVVDNNSIDREVTLYKPTHVVIEAYWVVPEKFEVLQKLHPHVKWIIRNHSEIPFLATEGNAIDWTLKYLRYPNVYVSANSDRAQREMEVMADAAHGQAGKDRVVYLPNHYTFNGDIPQHVIDIKKDTVDVGCFGAVRLLKNQLMQAVAAIEFAKKIGKKLRFHINYSRVEGPSGNNPLKNIEALFQHAGADYQLVKHGWMPHSEFVKVCATMDLALCVSFTETFCIVAADMVSMNVPIVVSHDIRWATALSKADPTNSADIVNKMLLAWTLRKTKLLQWLNSRGLKANIADAEFEWLRQFNNLEYHWRKELGK